MTKKITNKKSKIKSICNPKVANFDLLNSVLENKFNYVSVRFTNINRNYWISGNLTKNQDEYLIREKDSKHGLIFGKDDIEKIQDVSNIYDLEIITS